MTNLTVTVDEQVLRKARIRALENGTSINAVVSEYLQRYAGSSATEAGLAGFVELAAKSTAGSGAEGRTWRREDLYDRPKYLHQK